ncbi:uncharacterized protein LOC134693098 [Mytilus trossulus]|uniref:uncharacterized protein LOC134693098 n=1 Tax=Mytilus trossulus TaxID=6551 RepID=UPI003007CED7
MEVPSHMVPPDGIEFRESEMVPTQMGTWSTKRIPRETFLGPYVGEIIRDSDESTVSYRYAWEIFNLENGEYLYTINSTDPDHGNWMRYVNCARYLEEQNLVSVQKDMEMFYKAIKDIEPGEELLTWYQPFKKRRKKKMRSPLKSPNKPVKISEFEPEKEINASPEEITTHPAEDGVILGKRHRVKKKMFDDIILMSDLIPKRRRRSKAEIIADKEAAERNEAMLDDLSDGVPKKRRKKKKSLVEGELIMDQPVSGENKSPADPAGQKTNGRKKSTEFIVLNRSGVVESPSDLESSTSSESFKHTKGDALVSRPKTTEEKRQLAEIEASWTYPANNQEYQFEHLQSYAVIKNGRRFYKCDICSGIYRHTFSLKRHYLRNHINCRYLSKADMANCLVVPAQQWLDIKHANEESSLNQCLAKLASGTSLLESYGDQSGVNTPGLYRCCICNKLFDVLQTLTEHTQDHPATPDQKFFGCDQCKMRFTFHQNLLRHKLVHEDSRQKIKKKKDKNPPAIMGHFNQNDIHGKPYKCRLCPMKFKYQSNLEKHHQIHTSDRPYDCSICGKTFPNETNLKKHMVIHVGSTVHCKYCIQKFSHVGTLRKHIRLEHPIKHKERMLNLLESRDQGGTEAAMKLRNLLKQLRDLQETPLEDLMDSTEKDCNTVEKINTKIESKVPADSDQGQSSRFKFSCVVCKKRFSAYVNMCRHRRMAHRDYKETAISKNDESSTVVPNMSGVQSDDKSRTLLKSEKSGLRLKEPEKKKTEEEPTNETPESIQEFYANVASNIADNLNSYIDGGLDSLSNYKSYINIDNYDAEPEVNTEEGSSDEKVDVKWEQFNFPPNYNSKLIYENFQFIEQKYEDEMKAGLESKIDKSVFDDLAPALCTRRRSSSEWIALAEFSKNDSNHGDSPLTKEYGENKQSIDNSAKNNEVKEQRDESIEDVKSDNSIEKINDTERNIDSTVENEECQMSAAKSDETKGNEKEEYKSSNKKEENKNANEKEQNKNANEKEDKMSPEKANNTNDPTGGLSENETVTVSGKTHENISLQNKDKSEGEGTADSEIGIKQSVDKEGNKSSNLCQTATKYFSEETERSKCLDELSNSEAVCMQENVSSCHGQNCEKGSEEPKLMVKILGNLENIEVKETNDHQDCDISQQSVEAVSKTLEPKCLVTHETCEPNTCNTSYQDGSQTVCDPSLKSSVKAHLGESEQSKQASHLQNERTKPESIKYIHKKPGDAIKHADLFFIDLQRQGQMLNGQGFGTMKTFPQVKPDIKSESDSLCCDRKGDNSLKVNDSKGDNLPQDNLDCKQHLKSIEDKDGNKTECLETTGKIINNDMCQLNCLTEKSLDVKSTIGKENEIAVLNAEKTEPELNKTLGGAYILDASQLIQKLAKEVEKAQNTSNGPIDDFNLKTLAHIADALKETRDSERFSKESIPTVVNDIMESYETLVPNDKTSKPVQEIKLGEAKQETLDMKSKVQFEETEEDSSVSKQKENNDNAATKIIEIASGSNISESSGVMSLELFTDSDNESEDIFTGLALSKKNSTATGEEMKLFDTHDDDDYTERSPFHDYEQIQFGKHGIIFYVCSVCKKQFEDGDRLLRHQWKKHPSIYCHYLQVEQGHGIEYLFYSKPCNRGVLGVTGKALESVGDQGTYHCTRCRGTFKSVDRLRIHIINCAPKVEGTESSENKPKFKKKYRKHHKVLIKNEVSSPVKMKKETSISTDVRWYDTLSKPRKQYLIGTKNVKPLKIQEKMEFDPLKVNRRKKSAEMAYNPLNHIRRRELTEILDTHQCRGCGVKFNSISLLERHVKKCDGKDKFKDLKVMKSSVNDTFHQKQKHTCLYCNRGFSYPKTLMNHYKAFCLVKKDKVSKGFLTENDKQQESAMMMKLKQQEEDRCFTDIPEENVSGKKGWPRGMKRKWRRKNHCWTYIKKRKPSTEEMKNEKLSEESNIDLADENEKKQSLQCSSESNEGNNDESIPKSETVSPKKGVSNNNFMLGSPTKTSNKTHSSSVSPKKTSSKIKSDSVTPEKDGCKINSDSVMENKLGNKNNPGSLTPKKTDISTTPKKYNSGKQKAEKQTSPQKLKATKSPLSSKKKLIDQSVEVRQKRKYIKKKIFTFDDVKKVRKKRKSSEESIQSVIDSVANCDNVTMATGSKCDDVTLTKTVKSQVTKNSIIKMKKKVANEDTKEEKIEAEESNTTKGDNTTTKGGNNTSQEDEEPTTKKSKLSVKSVKSNKLSLSEAKTKVKVKNSPSKTKTVKQTKTFEPSKGGKSIKGLGKKSNTMNKSKVLFYPQKRLKKIKRELSQKLEVEMKQHDVSVENDVNSSIQKKWLEIKSDLAKNIETALQNVSVDLGIPVSHVIDHEFQNRLTKQQRMEMKKKLNEIGSQLFSVIEKQCNKPKPRKLSKNNAIVKSNQNLNVEGNTDIKQDINQSKDNIVSENTSSETTEPSNCEVSSDKETEDTTSAKTFQKKAIIKITSNFVKVSKGSVKNSPKKGITKVDDLDIAGNKLNTSKTSCKKNIPDNPLTLASVKTMPSEKGNLLLLKKKSVNVIDSPDKVVAARSNLSSQGHDDLELNKTRQTVNDKSNEKNLENLKDKQHSESPQNNDSGSLQKEISVPANKINIVPICKSDLNICQKKSGNLGTSNKSKSELPPFKSTPSKEDSTIPKKKVPIYNQEINTKTADKKDAKTPQAKTIFLKAVDSDLKRRLELAGHIPYTKRKPDIKIVQWNTKKQTGNQSRDKS